LTVVIGGVVNQFVAERAAFFGGFGDGRALLEGLRSVDLVVLLGADDLVPTWTWGGMPWLVAFTEASRCADFVEATERDLGEVRVSVMRGARVIDELMDRAAVPTGLVLDAASPDVMTFPPVQAITPHCFIDETTGKAVRLWAG
jgi:hypothetical protein